jgi:hypothetical protein
VPADRDAGRIDAVVAATAATSRFVRNRLIEPRKGRPGSAATFSMGEGYAAG